jgi:hypothetical protein
MQSVLLSSQNTVELTTSLPFLQHSPLTNILSAMFSMKTPATILIWPIRPAGAIYNGKLSKCGWTGFAPTRSPHRDVRNTPTRGDG